MENNNRIQDELQEISSVVANLNRRNVYSVPSGYFSSLPQLIINRITEADKAVLPFASNPFSVPQGYFDGLAAEILSKVAGGTKAESEPDNELAEVAPLLASLSKKNPYTVPAGYFNTLEFKQLATAKVVKMGLFKKITRYAAAAVITGALAVGGFFYTNNNTTDTAATSGFNKESLQQLSEQEIIEYLNASAVSGDVKGGQDQNLLHQTKELSDEEILQYLNENPEPGDAFQLKG